MALSDADKAEMKTLLAESFAEGIALFRSKAEEEDAKIKATQPPPANTGGGNGDDKPRPFGLAGFLLGGE